MDIGMTDVRVCERQYSWLHDFYLPNRQSWSLNTHHTSVTFLSLFPTWFCQSAFLKLHVTLPHLHQFFLINSVLIWIWNHITSWASCATTVYIMNTCTIILHWLLIRQSWFYNQDSTTHTIIKITTKAPNERKTGWSVMSYFQTIANSAHSMSIV